MQMGEKSTIQENKDSGYDRKSEDFFKAHYTQFYCNNLRAYGNCDNWLVIRLAYNCQYPPGLLEK